MLALAVTALLAVAAVAVPPCGAPPQEEDVRVLWDNGVFFDGSAPACPRGGLPAAQYGEYRRYSELVRRRRAELAGLVMPALTRDRRPGDLYFEGLATPNKTAGKRHYAEYWAATLARNRGLAEASRLALGQCVASEPDLAAVLADWNERLERAGLQAAKAPPPLPRRFPVVVRTTSGGAARAVRDCERWTVLLPSGMPDACRALETLFSGMEKARRLPEWPTHEDLVDGGDAVYTVDAQGEGMLALGRGPDIPAECRAARPARAGGLRPQDAEEEPAREADVVDHLAAVPSLPQAPAAWHRVMDACRGGAASAEGCAAAQREWDRIKCRADHLEVLRFAQRSCRSVKSAREAKMIQSWQECRPAGGGDAQPAEHYKTYECWARGPELPMEVRCAGLVWARITLINSDHLAPRAGGPDWKAALARSEELERETGLTGACTKLGKDESPPAD